MCTHIKIRKGRKKKPGEISDERKIQKKVVIVTTINGNRLNHSIKNQKLSAWI